MSFLARFSASPNEEEVLIHFDKFLRSVRLLHQPPDPNERPPLTGVDLTHTSIYLMKFLPVSRDAVLQYISDFYNQFVEIYFDGLDGLQVSISEKDAELLDEVHSALLQFINEREDIWARILSTWTIRLLGELSRHYAPRTVFASAQSVNDVINLWMTSPAIHSLLEITSRCLHCSEDHRGDFMSTLLETSARHSPHFDWVVAYVGNSCPQKVIKEVANVGLEAFSSRQQQPQKAEKVHSVIGILSHLVSTQSDDIKLYFERMIKESLSGESISAEKYAIPYLMRLCQDSTPLLDVLVDSVIPMITDSTLSKLEVLAPRWVRKYYKGYTNALSSRVAHLILKSSRGPKLIQIFLNGCKIWREPASLHAKFILDRIRGDILKKTMKWDPTLQSIRSFPCIPALRENYNDLIPFLGDPNHETLRVAKSLLTGLAFYDGYEVGIESICYFFRVAKTDEQIWALIDLIGTLVTKYPSILKDVCPLLMVKYGKIPQLGLWKVMIRIVKSENLPEFPRHFKLSAAIQENLIHLIQFFNSGGGVGDEELDELFLREASLVVQLISLIPDLTRKVRFGTLVSIERHLIELLFRILHLSGVARNQKVQTVSHICSLLRELSKEQAVQNDALRSLVQSSLNPECAPLFQSRVPMSKVIDEELELTQCSLYNSLLNENQKRSASLSLARVHSSSFHSGKLGKNSNNNNNTNKFRQSWSPNDQIGNGGKVEIVDNEDSTLNTQLLIAVLTSICMAQPYNSHFGLTGYVVGSPGKIGSFERNESPIAVPQLAPANAPVSVDATRKVALLLVEIVSPDVMFNGLPWPDEEFSKIQVERDLQIRRAFEDHPYLWDLLEFVANYSPSLCYCSVLMRALMATLIAHWTSCQEAKARSTLPQLEWTIRLVNIMKTGEIIPPPLSYIGEVVHELKASEIVGLLKDIWSYMKMNVPVPSAYIQDPKTGRFTRNGDFIKFDPMFTEKLRLAVLNNVEQLGYLFPKLFPLKQQQQDNRPSSLSINESESGNDDESDEKNRPPQIMSPSPTKELPMNPFLVVKTVPF